METLNYLVIEEKIDYKQVYRHLLKSGKFDMTKKVLSDSRNTTRLFLLMDLLWVLVTIIFVGKER